MSRLINQFLRDEARAAKLLMNLAVGIILLWFIVAVAAMLFLK